MRITEKNLIRGSIWELTEDLIFYSSTGKANFQIEKNKTITVCSAVVSHGLTGLSISSGSEKVKHWASTISGEAILRGGDYKPRYRLPGTDITYGCLDSTTFWAGDEYSRGYGRGETTIEIIDPALNEVVATIPSRELFSAIPPNRWIKDVITVREKAAHSYLQFAQDGSYTVLHDEHDATIALLSNHIVVKKLGERKCLKG